MQRGSWTTALGQGVRKVLSLPPSIRRERTLREFGRRRAWVAEVWNTPTVEQLVQAGAAASAARRPAARTGRDGA